MRHLSVWLVLVCVAAPASAVIFDPAKCERVTGTNPDGTIKWQQKTNKAAGKPIASMAPVPALSRKEGELVYNGAGIENLPIPPHRTRSVSTDDPARFHKAGPNIGTTNPRAIVAMLEEYGLALAFDALSPEDEGFDIVRVDFSGKGVFHDAPVVPWSIANAEGGTKENSWRFELHPLVVGSGASAWAVDFLCDFRVGSRPSLSCWVSATAQGLCRFGDKVHRVVFHDLTCNGRATDGISLDDGRPHVFGEAAVDACFVDVSGGRGLPRWAVGYVGQPIVVDGACWMIKVSADDRRVKAEPFAGPMGRLRVGCSDWDATLMGEKFWMLVSGGKEPVPVPADEYVITEFHEYETLRGTNRRVALYEKLPCEKNPSVVQVAESATATNLDIGSPYTIDLTASVDGNKVKLAVECRDAGGRWVTGYKAEPDKYTTTLPPPITVRISNSRGQREEEFEVWGDGRVWTVPDGVRDTFEATARFSFLSFESKPARITFSAEGNPRADSTTPASPAGVLGSP